MRPGALKRHLARGVLAAVLVVAAFDATCARAFTLGVVTPDTSLSRAATLAPREVSVPAGANGAGLRFAIEPIRDAAERWGERHAVGRVTVTPARDDGMPQVIDVVSHADASMFAANCHVVDVNFDGLPDLVTLAEFGASWGRWEMHVLDPATRRLVRDPLARTLSGVRAASLEFDAATRTITARHTSLAAPHAAQSWRVDGRTLVRAGTVARR